MHAQPGDCTSERACPSCIFFKRVVCSFLKKDKHGQRIAKCSVYKRAVCIRCADGCSQAHKGCLRKDIEYTPAGWASAIKSGVYDPSKDGSFTGRNRWNTPMPGSFWLSLPKDKILRTKSYIRSLKGCGGKRLMEGGYTTALS